MSLSVKQIKALLLNQDELSQWFNEEDAKSVLEQFSPDSNAQDYLSASVANSSILFDRLCEKIVLEHDLPAYNAIIQILQEKGERVQRLCDILQTASSDNAAKSNVSSDCSSSAFPLSKRLKIEHDPIVNEFTSSTKNAPLDSKVSNKETVSKTPIQVSLLASECCKNTNTAQNVQYSLPNELSHLNFAPNGVAPIICSKGATLTVKLDDLAQLHPTIYSHCWVDLWNMRRTSIDLPLFVFPKEVLPDGGASVVVRVWFELEPKCQHVRIMATYGEHRTKRGHVSLGCRATFFYYVTNDTRPLSVIKENCQIGNQPMSWREINPRKKRAKLDMEVGPVYVIEMHS